MGASVLFSCVSRKGSQFCSLSSKKLVLGSLAFLVYQYSMLTDILFLLRLIVMTLCLGNFFYHLRCFFLLWTIEYAMKILVFVTKNGSIICCLFSPDFLLLSSRDYHFSVLIMLSLLL